jgi:hypothetical protein
MEPKCFLPCSHESDAGSSAELVEPNPHLQILFLYDEFCVHQFAASFSKRFLACRQSRLTFVGVRVFFSFWEENKIVSATH